MTAPGVTQAPGSLLHAGGDKVDEEKYEHRDEQRRRPARDAPDLRSGRPQPDEAEHVVGEAPADEHQGPSDERERGGSTTVDATSTSVRRRKLRPLSISNTTLSARRAAFSTPVVPQSATATLITNAVAAVPLFWSAC